MGLILNGTNQYGQFPAESLFNNSAIFSYVVYFKPNPAATTEQFVFGGYTTGGLDRRTGTVYRGNNSPKYISKIKTGGTNYFNTAAPVSGWNVHIHSRNGTGGAAQPVRSVLNGTLFTGTQEENASTDIGRFGVGARRNNTGTYLDFFDGKIGCFAIWNRQLTPTEEAFLSANGNPSTITSGLVDYIEFFTAGSPATVTSLNSRVMTLVGSPSIDVDSPFVTIDTVNGGNPVKVGATFTANVSGFTGITSGTLGGKALTGLSYSAGVVTATVPNYSDASTFYQPDTTQTLSFVNGLESATKSVPTASPNGYNSVVIASPDNTNPLNVTYDIPTISNGDRIVFPTEVVIGSPTFGIDATGAGFALTAGARTLWHWNNEDSVMTRLDVTIAEGGAVVSVSFAKKITATKLTATKLTATKLTAKKA